MPFPPTSDLVEARAELRELVDRVLDGLQRGEAPGALERQRVDCKEEAGRRGRGGLLQPGQAHNIAVATQLADEVACFANTPGGGALIVGVEDKTGELLGAAVDTEWLRHRIYQAVDIAPLVEEHHVTGVRLVIVLIAAANEPIEDTSGRIRWRVGSHCTAVDRSEWWLHRQGAAGFDQMATATRKTVDDVSPAAVQIAREYLAAARTDDDASTAVPDELLRRLGAVLPDGRLTQAGALIFCPADRTQLSMSVLDVEGGDVLSHPPDLGGLSLLQQLHAVEQRLDAVNTLITLRESFVEAPVRRLPPAALREGIINGLVHRDWLQPEPVRLTWIQADSAAQIVSPGGFTGGVNAGNLLTQRFARNPALADIVQALRLVEKQGLGIDRMYREMVSLGHRPPMIVEDDGPRVRVRLVGGEPVVPVMALMSRIEPSVRRRDVRVALILDALLREPFVSVASVASLLQRTPPEAHEALDITADCRVGGRPLVQPLKKVWRLSSAALAVVEERIRSGSRARGLLPYRRPSSALEVVRPWLAEHDRVTSGDHATLSGLTVPGALSQLDRLVGEGYLVRGEARGRNAHFLPGPRLGSAAHAASDL